MYAMVRLILLSKTLEQPNKGARNERDNFKKRVQLKIEKSVGAQKLNRSYGKKVGNLRLD